MRTLTKRAACLVLAAAMVGSLVGCSKKSDKKTDDVVAAAESVMDALISRSSKKLAKAGDFSDETIAAIDEFGGRGEDPERDRRTEHKRRRRKCF